MASKAKNATAMQEAAALKKFLQKNDCFDKDLLITLSEMGVKSEDDLSKLDSNAKYDEVYRQLRVSRAKQLKDNAARIRLEKVMTKFEKLWRSKTNIKKKSSQTQNTKSKQKKKDPKSAKNAELAGDGKELKEWMKKNKVWEKSLYDALRANNINTADNLQSLNETQFDDIVRKVRVDRFSQLKDQAARNRADKLLVTFEKAWRKSSGVKKTSLNDKKSKKAKKDKAAKDDTAASEEKPADDEPELMEMTDDEAQGNKQEEAEDDNKEAAAEEQATSDGGKEEIKPWYLSGKERNTKSAALASNPRSPHQKKKDNKLNDKLRDSAKVEREWIEIYSRAKYGDYIAPPEEDKYGKKKKKKDDEEAGGDDAEEQKKEIPKLHEMEVDFDEIVEDVCIEMLLTLHESWEGRVSILNALIAQLCDENCSDDMYALKLCRFLCAIGHQFTDPRSLIIQAMEECISKLAAATPEKFIVFAPYVLTAVFNTFPVRIEALRDPGIKLGKFLIDLLSQKEYDEKRTVLRTVLEGLNSKHAAIRTECADYLDLMMRRLPVLEKDDASEEEQQLLKDVDDAVRKACKDAAAEARMNGYRALTVYKKLAPKAAEQIMEKMTKAQMDKFEEANADPHYE
eukprot:CAMPEP_0197073416 /NCGR_PEP_ID=MMETSP1384-20130603/210595_1 /TAXON_ID=29189 /ORGANISM="Ammonia sp." /LENGTH=625 /DNA_ID=CAMNT_0042512253 /DNA_START=15 /DNA_END=1892 /DNA_ORIENTATION=+